MDVSERRFTASYPFFALCCTELVAIKFANLTSKKEREREEKERKKEKHGKLSIFLSALNLGAKTLPGKKYECKK